MESILGNVIRKPDVAFYDSGRIDINCHAAKALSLKSGDVIDIMLDDGEMLMYVRHRAENLVGRYEAQCYPTNKFKFICNSFRAHSIKLCKAVLQKCNADNMVKLPIGEPVELEYWGKAVPLITRRKL